YRNGDRRLWRKLAAPVAGVKIPLVTDRLAGSPGRARLFLRSAVVDAPRRSRPGKCHLTTTRASAHPKNRRQIQETPACGRASSDRCAVAVQFPTSVRGNV